MRTDVLASVMLVSMMGYYFGGLVETLLEPPGDPSYHAEVEMSRLQQAELEEEDDVAGGFASVLPAPRIEKLSLAATGLPKKRDQKQLLQQQQEQQQLEQQQQEQQQQQQQQQPPSKTPRKAPRTAKAPAPDRFAREPLKALAAAVEGDEALARQALDDEPTHVVGSVLELESLLRAASEAKGRPFHAHRTALNVSELKAARRAVRDILAAPLLEVAGQSAALSSSSAVSSEAAAAAAEAASSGPAAVMAAGYASAAAAPPLLHDVQETAVHAALDAEFTLGPGGAGNRSHHGRSRRRRRHHGRGGEEDGGGHSGGGGDGTGGSGVGDGGGSDADPGGGSGAASAAAAWAGVGKAPPWKLNYPRRMGTGVSPLGFCDPLRARAQLLPHP